MWEPDLNVTPRTADFACGTIIAEVFVPEPIGALLFANHLPNWQLTFEHERELQTAIVGRAIEEITEERGLRHVVLAGDLDATPETASVRFWRGLQSLGGMSVCYRDAWGSTHPGEPDHTFTAENPLVTAENWDWELELGRRIDHIFVRCSAHGPPWTYVPASVSSTSPCTGSGAATTSACWRTSAPRPPPDDPCGDLGLASHATPACVTSSPLLEPFCSRRPKSAVDRRSGY